MTFFLFIVIVERLNFLYAQNILLFATYNLHKSVVVQHYFFIKCSDFLLFSF